MVGHERPAVGDTNAGLPLPWTAEYQQYREQTLTSLVSDADVRARFADGSDLPPGYGAGLDERCVELPWLLSQLPRGAGRLLDAGSSLNHTLMLNRPVVAEKQLHIVTLTPEEDAFWRRGISYVYEDLRSLPYKDGLFDIVVSVSTLEHVGCDNRFYGSLAAVQALDDFPKAAREMSRVLRPGGLLLLTVPYGVHRFHGAFQQFDRRRLSMALDGFGEMAAVQETFYRYARNGWQRASDEACADAEYVAWVAALMRTGQRPPDLRHEHDYAAAARAVACVRMVKGDARARL